MNSNRIKRFINRKFPTKKTPDRWFYHYQTFFAGILAIIAALLGGGAVIYAQKMDINEQKKMRIQEQLEIAHVMDAQAEIIARFADQFDRKLCDTMGNAQQPLNKDARQKYVKLTTTAAIFDKMLTEVRKLPPDAAKQIIYLSSAYNDVYKDLILQFDNKPLIMTPEICKQIIKGISGELRGEAKEVRDILAPYIDKKQKEFDILTEK